MERKRNRKHSGHRRCKTCGRDLRHSLHDCTDPDHAVRVVEYSQEQAARYKRDRAGLCTNCHIPMQQKPWDCDDPVHREKWERRSAWLEQHAQLPKVNSRWEGRCPDCKKGMRHKPPADCSNEQHLLRYTAHRDRSDGARDAARSARYNPYLLAWYGEGPRPSSGSLCPGCMGRQLVRSSMGRMQSCPECTPTLKELTG